ncbi:MAG: hypothetical protein DYH04_14585 [Nitrospira sp. NTP2]|nr:hypothetical protein [Nitrospira sp. NTP2]
MSCVPTTGTKAALTSAERSTIKKAGILVESGGPFSVRIARDKMTNTGALLFGLVGAGVEAGYKASKDASYEEELTPFVQGFDVIKDSSMAFQENFLSTKLFSMSEIVRTRDELKERGFDALFTETIEEWGLRLCLGVENVQVAFDIHAKLVLLSDNVTVWERDELFTHGPCRPLADFRNDRELLGVELKRATKVLAGRIANEIAFP